jgi:hypothetical protein
LPLGSSVYEAAIALAPTFHELPFLWWLGNFVGLGVSPFCRGFLTAEEAEGEKTFDPSTRGCARPAGWPSCKAEVIVAARPNYVLILPWNLKREIMQQLACIRDWGGRFAIPITEPEVAGRYWPAAGG